MRRKPPQLGEHCAPAHKGVVARAQHVRFDPDRFEEVDQPYKRDRHLLFGRASHEHLDPGAPQLLDPGAPQDRLANSGRAAEDQHTRRARYRTHERSQASQLCVAPDNLRVRAGGRDGCIGHPTIMDTRGRCDQSAYPRPRRRGDRRRSRRPRRQAVSGEQAEQGPACAWYRDSPLAGLWGTLQASCQSTRSRMMRPSRRRQ